MPKDKTILTIHDVGTLHIRSGLRRLILKKLLSDLPIRRLKFITAVSEATKKEIIRYTNCDENKIRVIENPLFKRFNAVQKKSFDRQLPTLLQIGTTDNKNLYKLIEALEGVNCRLRIIGTISDEIQKLLEKKKVIYKNKANLDDDEMRKEYENADIVTFCSTYEGFGLPIIEAQAMLTPVVTSNRSPMKEVAGEGAMLVEPNNSESIQSRHFANY